MRGRFRLWLTAAHQLQLKQPRCNNADQTNQGLQAIGGSQRMKLHTTPSLENFVILLDHPSILVILNDLPCILECIHRKTRQ